MISQDYTRMLSTTLRSSQFSLVFTHIVPHEEEKFNVYKISAFRFFLPSQTFLYRFSGDSHFAEGNFIQCLKRKIFITKENKSKLN